MNRRILLKLMVAASLAGALPRSAQAQDLRVVVAGAGIIGASIAYQLAKAGVQVTILDKEGPATHATRGTFAWINATWAKQPRRYHRLNQKGVANWRDLQATLDIPIRWGGSLEWFTTPSRQNKLVSQIAEQVVWGESARMVNPLELAQLEPNINFAGADQAALSENDGAVDPVIATQKMLAAAREYGAAVHYPSELTGVLETNGKLHAVQTSHGEIRADKLILATGAAPDATQQFAGIDVPQRSTPGVIIVTKPVRPLLNRIVVAPGIHMHQRADGRVVLGEQEGAPQTDAHFARLAGRPNKFPTTALALEHAERMMHIARRFLPMRKGVGIEDVHIGWRPLPLDGHPVMGASPTRPDVYLAIMHSGVSLAPIVGQLVTQELLAGENNELLREYRPDRQFKTVRRY